MRRIGENGNYFQKSAVELTDVEIKIVSGLSFGQIEVRPAPMGDLSSYTSPLEEAISLDGFEQMHSNSWLLAYLHLSFTLNNTGGPQQICSFL